MLATWLGALSLEDFEASCWHRGPLARAGTALASCELLTWGVLERVLRAGADVLVVARGQLVDVAAPRSLAELQPQLAAGIGLCVRHTERHDQGLAALAASFGSLGAAQVQLFVTPGGTHGFGWHYDDEDVFIVQTAGAKDYFFRANTVASHVPARRGDFARFHGERSELCTATLVAGDFLYLPSRWWHMALCRETSLSLSVGVAPRAASSSP